jgi:hypothetical protein
MENLDTDWRESVVATAERATWTLTPGMPYEDAADLLKPRELGSFDMIACLVGFKMRERFVRQYGFSMLTCEELDTLAEMLGGQKVVEVGAGSGYLSAQLSLRGVNVLASDSGDWKQYEGVGSKIHKRDHEGDSVVMLGWEVGSVVMSWPPIGDPFAYKVAMAMEEGQVLFYEGEGPDGCTADSAFFAEVEDESRWERLNRLEAQLNRWHLRFDGMRNQWSVFKKKYGRAE